MALAEGHWCQSHSPLPSRTTLWIALVTIFRRCVHARTHMKSPETRDRGAWSLLTPWMKHQSPTLPFSQDGCQIISDCTRRLILPLTTSLLLETSAVSTRRPLCCRSRRIHGLHLCHSRQTVHIANNNSGSGGTQDRRPTCKAFIH